MTAYAITLHTPSFCEIDNKIIIRHDALSMNNTQIMTRFRTNNPTNPDTEQVCIKFSLTN